MRRCLRTTCMLPAVSTLTYEYSESTLVIGPLSPEKIPGAIDLCAEHGERMRPPEGWDIIRIPLGAAEDPDLPEDDLLALAAAVREIGLRHDEEPPAQPTERRSGHLRLLRFPE